MVELLAEGEDIINLTEVIDTCIKQQSTEPYFNYYGDGDVISGYTTYNWDLCKYEVDIKELDRYGLLIKPTNQKKL